jgi:hypothetical protein
MRRIGWIVAGAITLALVAGPAAAGDQSPPDLDLRYRGKHAQHGNMSSFCWSGDGVGQCGDGPYSFPPAVQVKAGNSLRIRMRTSEQPRRFRIYRYHELDENGAPVGDAKRVPRDLRKVWRDGKLVAWDALFHLYTKDKHYYLSVDTVWFRGDASYEFHVQTKE